MAQNRKVEFLDSIHVSPPPASVPTTPLPLTFFDLPWFFVAPKLPADAAAQKEPEKFILITPIRGVSHLTLITDFDKSVTAS
ncbi:hypothetical protein COLO4_13663 [Corchorus olitorius]|uniref:Uncharacterized protein n=1 Tax=Corchorus olitorius TaxID=93759 RepID=A0A1R3JVM3_9ROSI|nr:hypothetical protein COLO4_13663 [Corchorus olitorius]